MKAAHVLLILSILLLLLIGCANESSTPIDSSSAATAVPLAVVVTPSSSQFGTVTGKLLQIQTNGDIGPYPVGVAIYLGVILKSDQGVEGLVALDKENAPRATT